MRRQRREYYRITAASRKYVGIEAFRLRDFAVRQVLPLAKNSRHWQRALRWIRGFEKWARPFLSRESARLRTKLPYRTVQELLLDRELIRLFFRYVMKNKVGFSVPRSARRFLSEARVRLGSSSLNEDKELTDLIVGYERKTPRTVVQAGSLDVDDVQRIAAEYSVSEDWFLLQLALLVCLGFVAILRMGELTKIKVEDVHLVPFVGRDMAADSVSELPGLDMVKGAFVHLVSRKASQAFDVWIPVACRTTLSLLLQQLQALRREGRRSGPLLTSRLRKGGPRHPTNRISTQSATDGLREALRKVCGMSMEQSMLYKGHSLRVGGSNYIRRLGIDDEIHRLMGGWASLSSSRGYFKLSTVEQLQLAEEWALKTRQSPGRAGSRPVTLDSITAINIG